MKISGTGKKLHKKYLVKKPNPINKSNQEINAHKAEAALKRCVVTFSWKSYIILKMLGFFF